MAPLAPPALEIAAPAFRARVWGSRDLRAWYPERGLEAEAIGEAWLSPPQCPVLVKLLFPRERLSVQVHPDDAYAAAHGLGRGKSEAWYVVEAEPGARVGVGLKSEADWRQLGAACRAGRGAELLDWIEVAPGEVISIPAGTVHAIGGGLVLLEVQQPSDNTFRLDDYGRGRELHLGAGLEVARPTAAGRIAHGLAAGASGLL
ncbi:MAG: class I mannose-6-phosphate isomerase, partial [Terriglobales bacterium]